MSGETDTLLNTVEGGNPVEGNAPVEGNDPGKESGGEGDGGAPEAYADFELPEGVELDETLLKETTPMFKELGLSQEGAQRLVSLYANQLQSLANGQVEAFNKAMETWKTDSLNDKEFGGEGFEENLGIARQAVEKFGTPELMQLLSEHGVGNHPEMVRFMYRVGKAIKSDTAVGGTGQAVTTEQNRVQQMYPDAS